MSARLTVQDHLLRSIPEAVFQQQVIDLAHTYRWTCAHFRGVRQQRRNGSVFYSTPVAADGEGFPDLCLVRGNRLIFAELKRETGKLEPLQERWLAELEGTPAEVWIWRPRDMADGTIEGVLK